MTTRIIFVRHGRTAWNTSAERFRGIEEIPLDEVGEAQAAAVSRRLANTHLDAVYASPLGRTMRTAEIVAAPHRLPVIPLRALIALNYGVWGGLTFDEAQQQYPEQYDLFLHHIEKIRFPGGESLADVRRRLAEGIAEMGQKHEGQTVLMTSHQMVLRVMLCLVLNIDNSHYWDFGQDPCCIDIVDLKPEGKFLLQTMNDVCHLA